VTANGGCAASFCAIVAVRLDEARRHGPGEFTGAAGFDRHGGGEIRVHVEVDEVVVGFVVRRDVLVAQPVVDREVAAHAPVVLKKEVPVAAPHLQVAGPVLHRRLLRVSQQKIRQVEAGAGHGAAIRER
jgi:hypothetical protein